MAMGWATATGKLLGPKMALGVLKDTRRAIPHWEPSLQRSP